jgi:hypothetical protein
MDTLEGTAKEVAEAQAAAVQTEVQQPNVVGQLQVQLWSNGMLNTNAPFDNPMLCFGLICTALFQVFKAMIDQQEKSRIVPPGTPVPPQAGGFLKGLRGMRQGRR